MQKILFVASSLLLAGMVNAAPATSDITLPVPGNGVIAPHSTLTLPVSALLPNVYYYVDCSILNETNSKVGMVFNFNFIGSTRDYTKLNGVSIGTGQAMLIPGVNAYQSPGIAITSGTFPGSETGLTFENADDTNAVKITNCVAHFLTSTHSG